ncbi:Gfo/Idh/MocA family protein [Halovenus rubra]|uniref:Gfo/Idh/MocA family protein n=2 Tax=Halovenus rubra TaxID=869890 RepID=A0ABD5X7Q2_9EURY|nr:Gfo/Idh/MocA family oxidoreductase [Halovenus rubra]
MHFGVISTATIGRKRVIPAIQQTDGATVAAIASRDQTHAEEVAAEFNIPTAYGSYAELLEDDRIDAIYNPLPNSLHAEWTKRSADAGLDVLCEKPLGVNAQEAKEMTAYCEDRGVTLMEAFMYRYHPRTQRARDIAANHLGEIRRVDAQFHFTLPDEYNVRLDPDLAGGSLMDVGCYTVTAARLFLGEPKSVYATAVDNRGCGVETNLTGHLSFSGGKTATISSGFDESVHQYTVLGTEGRLEVDRAFVPDGETTLCYTVDGRTVEERFDPVDQYKLEVEAFLDAVESGESPRTDGNEAVRTMRVVDALYESVDCEAPVTL